MNRKAKRNKYRKLQRELERKIDDYNRVINLHSFAESCRKEVKIQQISCMKLIEEYSRLPPNVLKEYYEKEIAHQMAEEILKHPEFYKITDTGYGYRYDLSIVKVE